MPDDQRPNPQVKSPLSASAWLSYAAAVCGSLAGLIVSALLGGPIAAAIAAIIIVPSLIASAVATFAVRIKFKPRSGYAAFGLGLGIYAATIVTVLAGLTLYGPAQIM